MLLERLDTLARLTDDLSRAGTVDEVYAVSLDCLQASLGVERAAILLFDANDVMSFVAWRGISEAYREAVTNHTPWRPDTRNPEPLLVADAERESSLAQYCEVFRAEGIRALGFFALTHRDRVIGKFMLYYAAPHEFTPEEVALAKTIAGQIAFGVTRIVAEQALDAARERLSATVSAVPGMVWETVGQRVTFVSDGIRELIGYEPEDCYRDPDFWSRVIVERLDVAPNVRHYKLRRRDGREIWVEVRSAHSRVNGAQISRGVTMDITERKLAEERNALLTEASGVMSATLDYEKSLAQIAELIVAGLGDWCVIDVVDDDAVARVAVRHRDPAKSAAAERLRTDFPPGKLEIGLGRRVVEANAPILLRQIDEQLAASIESSPVADIFEELGCQSLMIVPLTAAGAASGAISIVSANPARRFDENDLAVAAELGLRAGYAIDHARLYRQAQAAGRAKDEFLATLSHELRTPMTATLGWASMLRMTHPSQETFQLGVETIERSVLAQARLLEDIFDVSRIVTGKLRLQVAPVELPRIIHAAVETVQPSIAAKSLRLELAIDEGASAALLGDAARLQQVIWNLLSNAVKFTPAGGAIRIDVHRAENAVEIAVRDSGQGIPKRVLPFVFERFRQGDSTATRAHGGLGLGLAIVKSIVEGHGGAVAAESEGEGHGATFTVSLPLAHPEAHDGLPLADGAANGVSLAGVNVLVVEDDDDTRRMMSMALEIYGASVVSVSSAAAAIDALRSRPPHVVVSDIAMPGEDGYSLMMKIRAGVVEACRDVPAVAVTAFARPQDRDRILAAGFREHLTKPVDTKVMLQTVRDLVAPATPPAPQTA